MAFVKIGAAVHHYVDAGARDKPALLFANGLGTDLRMWDPLVPLLAGDFRLIRYDTRGHGLSEAPPPPYSASDLAGDVAGLLDALNVGAAVICGLSAGGVVGPQVSLAFPGRGRGALLCGNRGAHREGAGRAGTSG